MDRMAEAASGGDVSGASETSSARRKTPFGLAITVAGRYRRGACLAKGGSSTVHRAVDQTSGNEVALKSFHVHRAFDPTLLPSLEAGRAIASRVGPDVLVPILDLGADDDGTPYVIMPLVKGRTLGERLEVGASETHDFLAIAARVLASLDALHAAGVTHGDLSPDNVLLRDDDGVALLLDHEGLGEIGAPRASRTTEGFGEHGGLRERRDDHRALLRIACALRGTETPRLDTAALDRLVLALRTASLDQASDLLGWSALSRVGPAEGDRPSWRRPLAIALFVGLFAILVLVAVLAHTS